MTAASVKSGTGCTRLNLADNYAGTVTDAMTTPRTNSLVGAAAISHTSSDGSGINWKGRGGLISVNAVTLGDPEGGRYALSSAQDFSAANKLCYAHVSTRTKDAKLEPLSQHGGIGIYMNSSSSGTEEAQWFCRSNTYQAVNFDYKVMVVDPNRATDASVYDDGTGGRGTFDPSDVTDIGIVRTVTNAFGGSNGCASFGYLTPITVIGGTGADPEADFTVIQDHLDDARANLNTGNLNAPYCYFRVKIGDGGTNAVEFTDSNRALTFPPAPNFSDDVVTHVDSGEFGHEADLGASDKLHLTGYSWNCQDYNRWESKGSSSADCVYTGCAISNVATSFILVDGHTFASGTISSSIALSVSQPTINGSTISDAPGVALHCDTDEPLTNCTGLTFSNNITAIEVDITGDPSTCDIDISGHTFSGNATDILYSGTGTLTITGTAAQEAALATSAPSGTIVWNTPTITLTVNSDQSGSDIKIFETGTQTIEASATGTQATTTTLGTYDITVQKAGFLPQRRTGVALGASSVTLDFELVDDPVYDSGHGLTFTTDYSYNPTTRVITIVAAQQGRSVYSALIDDFISETSLRNYPFPISAVGIDRFDFLSDGTTAATIDSGDIQFWRGAGFTIEHATTGNHTARYCYINGTGTNASGTKGYYQQVDGASPTALTLVSNNVQSAIQYYTDTNGDGTPDSNYEDHLVIKLFNDGYYQKAVNVLTAYDISALEPQEYIVDLGMTETGLGTGDRSITVTVTDNSTTPVEEQTGYFFDYKIEGGASDSPEDLLRQWIFDIYTDPTASDYASKVNFNWPDPIVESGGSYSTQRGFVYGQDTTTTFSGFYVEEGSDYHPDFLRQQGNDGTYFTTPVVAQINVSGMTTTETYVRLQLWNATALTASARANSTAYSVGDLRLRSTGLGTENTAGMYLRCTTAGTSAGSEPTWNTTPGATTTDGTAVWTIYNVLQYDADPASATYNTTYNDGEEFASGELAGYRFASINSSTAADGDSGTAVVSSSGFTIAISPEADTVYATNAVDGQVEDSKFSPDFTNDYIVLDTNSDFQGIGAYAYYRYILTTSQGMWEFWGGVTALDVSNYRINTAIVDLYFDESGGFVKQTDSVRIYRDDNARPAIDPTTGGYGIELNWRNPVYAYDGGGGGFTSSDRSTVAAIKSKTDSLTFTQTGHVDSNIKRVADLAVSGSGTVGDPWGP